MKALFSIYLLLLGLTLGLEVAIALFAPILFGSDLYIEPGTLSALQAGTLLGQFFLKYSLIALFVAIFALLFEALSWRKNTSDIRLKISTFMLALLLVILAGIFCYCVDFIMNNSNNIDEKFNAVHKASEMVLKTTMVAQLLLFFLKAKIFLGLK